MLTSLCADDGATATITDCGAQVASWQPAQQPERLFLSAASPIDSGVALRGGVPVIFPQFAGFGPLPKHGFARNQIWQRRAAADARSAVFALSDNDQSRAIWPHRFLAELSVRVGGTELVVELAIQNNDAQPFAFTAALHTYLRVHHLPSVRILGLQGTRYLDTVAGGEHLESAPALLIDGQVDRIYVDAPPMIRLEQNDHVIDIHSNGFADAVVWNPGKPLSDSLADMEPDGYQRMLCIEAAQIIKPIELHPGQRWLGSQRLKSMLR